MPKKPESPDVPDAVQPEPKDATRYIKAGQGCPYCGTNGNPEGGPWEVLENGVGQQEMGCTECGASWFDIYHLASVFDNDAQEHYK